MTGPLLTYYVFLMLVITAAALLLPRMQRQTLPFGVRIPPDRVGEPVIAHCTRTYRQRLLIIATVLLALAVTLALTVDSVGLGVALVFLTILAHFSCYLAARRILRQAKESEHWFAGATQRVVADTGLRTEPERFPWLWAVPPVVLLLAAVVLGVVRYPDLPAVIATHYSLRGADRFAAKSPFTVAAPVLVQTLVNALVIGIVALSLRSRPDLDPSSPRRSSAQYRIFLRRLTRALLVMLACIDLGMLLIWWQLWSARPPARGGLIAAFLAVAAGIVVILVVSVRSGQGGSRIAVPGADAPESSGAAARDDDRYWRAGIFYVNRDDPAIMVPKRFGVGWTVNFGNPFGALILGTPLVVALGIVLLTRL